MKNSWHGMSRGDPPLILPSPTVRSLLDGLYPVLPSLEHDHTPRIGVTIHDKASPRSKKEADLFLSFPNAFLKSFLPTWRSPGEKPQKNLPRGIVRLGAEIQFVRAKATASRDIMLSWDKPAKTKSQSKNS